ncbi:MAG: sensor histidine kinase [Streptosporangiaceae bacterium]
MDDSHGRGPRRPRGLAAPLALPAAFGALLSVGAVAAATHGALSGLWVLGLATAVAAVASAVAEPPAAPVLAVISWLTVIGFSGAPYAQLRPGGSRALIAALVIGGGTIAGLAVGLALRRAAESFTLWIVDVSGEARSGRGWNWTGGIGRRRLLSGVLLVGGLPLLTWLLSLETVHPLGDILLVYLVAVVAIAVVGGFWPAVLAAITASLLVNWYFTPPVHTLTIGDGESLLALLLFITVAVTVSSVVHLAAHRARQAARSTGEARELLTLAQAVLGGADSPVAVLAHLTGGYGGQAELLERAGGHWVRVAVSGAIPVQADGQEQTTGPESRAPASTGLVLVATGQTRLLTERLLHGYAAQAAAALDRDRLRTQAAQAEALAEGNRMRTALLAAVSHDLRTPLASIKASVSTLRQTDVSWAPDDEAELLATIERSCDRLDALIGNLLDMSRLTAGSLQPFLRPTAIDEVAPVALRGLDAGTRMRLRVPDDLPLVRTDPGLLERVLANLFANALAYSPPHWDPELRARPSGGSVLLEIIDHGSGVPDELKSLMFEPFRRLEGRSGPGPAGAADPVSELAIAGGVGLGLAVVRGFLDIMGGSVEARDTPHGGLTMAVRLPAVTGAAAADLTSADRGTP